jgi:hypothetical protein
MRSLDLSPENLKNRRFIMSIRIWVFLALLAMMLVGVGGVSATYAQDGYCDSRNGGYMSEEDHGYEDRCHEERKREEREEKESGRCSRDREPPPSPDVDPSDLSKYDGVGQDRASEQREPSSCYSTPYPCGTGLDGYIMCY